MEQEEWRAVVSWEGYYEVSNIGRVRRIKAGKGARAGHVMSPRRGPYLTLQLSRNDQRSMVTVHSLVAEAFHGKRPDGLIVNHKDLNKHNNLADNLEWVTYSGNNQHAIDNGAMPEIDRKGEANGRSKLTAEQVAEIRKQKGKMGARKIAAIYGVCRSTIQFIHQDKHWNHPVNEVSETAS